KQVVKHAWKSAEPGVIFIDNVNRDNPLPGMGRMECCNPCGEQYLHPYQACNLVTVNLNKALTDANTIDWDKLSDISRMAARFSDNAIDVSGYPLPEIEKAVKDVRRIGVGIMGLADILIKMRISYNSEDARKIAASIMDHVRQSCMQESEELAKERGVFPAYDKSVWALQNIKVRNAAFTSIQPNGSTSIIANASASCEPLFNVYYIRRTGDGKQFIEVHEGFKKDIEACGLDINEIIKKLEACGTIQNISEIPDEIKSIYKCSQDISPIDHIKMQAALQKYVNGGISKTVNCPASITENDIYELYIQAWKAGCKGITVYREGCRNSVLSTKAASVEEYEKQLVAFLQSKYINEEWSPREIADALGVSVTTVFARLKKYGIKRRDIKEIRQSRRKKLARPVRAAIYGNLLGTSRIMQVERQGSFRLITRHYDYASYVRDLFSDQGIQCGPIMEIYTDKLYYYFDTEFLDELYNIAEYFFSNGRRVVPDALQVQSDVVRHYYLSEGIKTDRGGIKLDGCPKKLQKSLADAIGIQIADKGDYAYIPKKYTEDFFQYIESRELLELRETEISSVCPECGGIIEYKEKCKMCPGCGWSACTI
ncbi:hypothetical protein KKE60_06265, partial [Patescibacteria group bacterium]|nr:hypothetical protein [Patescibacteria group bacterium]